MGVKRKRVKRIARVEPVKHVESVKRVERVTIEYFSDHPQERQYCFIWTRAVDSKRVMFGCDTKENCERTLAYYQERAAKADAIKADAM